MKNVVKEELKNEVETYNVAPDGGNTEIKVIYNGEYTTYDNIYAKDSHIDYNTMNLSEDDMDEYLQDILNVKFTYHVGQEDCKIQEFLFGNLATNNKSDLEERTNGDKSADEMLVMTSILSSVNFIIDRMDPNQIKKEMIMNFNVSTGLPYHEYSIDNKREMYEQHFLGQHIIEFLDPRYPVEKVTLNIENVIVNSEGMSALKTEIEINQILNEETMEDLINTVWCMIDIGGYSTDIIGGIWRRKRSGLKLETIDSLSLGLKYGIATAQDEAIKTIFKEYHTNYGKLPATFKITRKDINDAEMRTKNKGLLNNRYKTNTLDYTVEEYKKIARRIANDFAQKYIANSQMDSILKIYLSGGGSKNEILVEVLKEELENRGINKEFVECVTIPDPVYVNAYSYYLQFDK
ncbi:hypothetical protein FDB50_16930 [Clostridium botulinum]|uniref:ParM/StbA family protein n=1 Tax=Clostridium botulinum TaxID=1491 RepID=A0A846K5P4_CLOBO|nr:hypothetical protein [Clostridium botulinum]NFN06377.1 hypothetical protein [Clostridium botulinum]NFN19761.1 hypothetical protein [Clostridium botulinum]NFN36753.1 hypothetical protein [Clostridium botulinum]